MNPAVTHRHVIVRLLNGPIYQEDLDLWGRLGAEWEKIKNHFFEMGLEVARDDSAGYAFIRQLKTRRRKKTRDGRTMRSPLCRESLGALA